MLICSMEVYNLLSLNIKYEIAIIYIYFMVTNSISVHRNTIL